MNKQEIKEKTIRHQRRIISEKIVAASENGKYHCLIEGFVDLELIFELESDGFKLVKQVGFDNELYIDWSK